MSDVEGTAAWFVVCDVVWKPATVPVWWPLALRRAGRIDRFGVWVGNQRPSRCGGRSPEKDWSGGWF